MAKGTPAKGGDRLRAPRSSARAARPFSQQSWKERLASAWRFLWHDDSLLSWLLNVLLAFLFIKFLLYPGLGLILGTKFPVVAVVSSSMEHEPSNFDAWWAENEDFYLRHNITRFEFLTYPFRNGFNKGDIMILTGKGPDALERGEVIVYWSRKPYPIIHRYIGTNPEGETVYLMSKGDNNADMAVSFDLDERRIHPENLLGTAFFRIPYLGYVKIWAVDLLTLIVGAPS